MSADPAWVRDLFAELGTITTRSMMGGLCVYADGRLFAATDREGTLYLRARGPFAEELAAMGARPFVYCRPDGTEARMAYRTLPDHALDDPTAACDLARRSLAKE